MGGNAAMAPRGQDGGGQIEYWHDERGYGFVRDSVHGDRIFLHVSDVGPGQPRPVDGDTVSFRRGTGSDGRPAAKQVKITTSPKVLRSDGRQRRASPGDALRIGGAVLLLAAVMAAMLLGRPPTWLLSAYLSMGAVSIGLYWYDKRQAARGGWRVAEFSLHLIDAAFGVAGGLIAQGAFRHKTRKPAFQLVSALILAAHAAYIVSVVAGSPLIEP